MSRRSIEIPAEDNHEIEVFADTPLVYNTITFRPFDPISYSLADPTLTQGRTLLGKEPLEMNHHTIFKASEHGPFKTPICSLRIINIMHLRNPVFWV